MSTYRAVVCRRLGGGDGLALEHMECLPMAAGMVRVAVEAACLNFPDLLMAQGLYQFKPPLPFVLGMEAAGRVIETHGPSRFAIGDPVFVMNKTGAFAEEMVAPEANVRPLPRGMSMDEGAAFGVASITAFHAVKTRAAVKPGQTVLVLGAAGGVGAATVQFAKALGATVIAAASNADKLEFAKSLGANHLIDCGASVLEKEVAGVTGGRGVDVIVDPVGWQPESLTRSVAFGGQILIVGFAGGTIPNYPANRLLLNGASLVGVRAGEAGRNDPAAREVEWRELLSLAESADVKPRVSKRYPLAEFRAALDDLAGRRALGRVVLTC